jgi:hypothetical protein
MRRPNHRGAAGNADDVPSCVNLTALPTEVQDHLAQAPGVAAHHAPALRVRCDDEFDALGRWFAGRGRDRLVQQVRMRSNSTFSSSKRSASILDRSSTPLMSDSSALGAAADDVQVLALRVVERGFGQDLRHADDAVHGRADLVAQVGEKAALGAIGRFGRELGVERGLFGELAVGDELHRAGQAQRRAVCGAFGLARARIHS